MSFRNLGRVAVFLFLLLVVTPVAVSLGFAALYGAGLVGLFAPGVTTLYLERVFGDANVWASLKLSLFVAGGVVALTLMISLPLALVLRRRLESGYLSHVLTLPLAIPGTVAGLLGTQILGGTGLLSRISTRFGLTQGSAEFPALTQDPWALGIVITHVFVAVPFFVLLLAEVHKSDRVDELGALAAMLGATPSQSLRRVTLPILLRGVRPALTLLFVVVLLSFEIPLMLGRQSPQMASVLIWRKYALFDLGQKPEAYLLALSFALVAMAVAAAGLRSRLTRDAVS